MFLHGHRFVACPSDKSSRRSPRRCFPNDKHPSLPLSLPSKVSRWAAKTDCSAYYNMRPFLWLPLPSSRSPHKLAPIAHSSMIILVSHSLCYSRSASAPLRSELPDSVLTGSTASPLETSSLLFDSVVAHFFRAENTPFSFSCSRLTWACILSIGPFRKDFHKCRPFLTCPPLRRLGFPRN